MNINLIVVGKTDAQYIQEAISVYFKRVNFYTNFVITTIADVKTGRGITREVQKRYEGEKILSQIVSTDFVVLLDENGAEYTSEKFADWLQKRMNSGAKRLCFVIGGPYGFSQGVYNRANEKIALSKMTFSHQIIRTIFTEQLYRAFTIINNEPYHHQ